MQERARRRMTRAHAESKGEEGGREGREQGRVLLTRLARWRRIAQGDSAKARAKLRYGKVTRFLELEIRDHAA